MITNFAQFKEACYKTILFHQNSGRAEKVIRLFYTNNYEFTYFYTNSMKEAYKQFKLIKDKIKR